MTSALSVASPKLSVSFSEGSFQHTQSLSSRSRWQNTSPVVAERSTEQTPAVSSTDGISRARERGGPGKDGVLSTALPIAKAPEHLNLQAKYQPEYESTEARLWQTAEGTG